MFKNIRKIKLKTLRYDSSLKEKWTRGELQQSWSRKYPDLFDEDDLDFALNQKNQHFGEWFAAIYYFQRGWKVFIEHYAYGRRKNSPFFHIRERKNKKVKQLIGEKGFNFLRYLGGKERQIRPPDLFVFNDKGKFFFAEVKWGTDRLRNYQQNFFSQIKKKIGARIELISVLPKL